MTGKGFDLASTWFSSTIVPPQISTSNEEGIDNSQSNSVASYSVTFADPIINDVLNSVHVPVSKEVDTSVSEEYYTNISEEVVTSVSEECGTSASEEAITSVPEEDHSTSIEGRSTQSEEELDSTMPIMANLDVILLRQSKRTRTKTSRLIKDDEPKPKGRKLFGLLTIF